LRKPIPQVVFCASLQNGFAKSVGGAFGGVIFFELVADFTKQILLDIFNVGEYAGYSLQLAETTRVVFDFVDYLVCEPARIGAFTTYRGGYNLKFS
jgi:hypothetical protein